MEKLRNNRQLCRLIGILLVMAMFVAGFQSIHFHVHHHDSHSTDLHSHNIDMHADHDSSHHDESTQVFDIKPQGVNKISGDDSLQLIAVLLVLLLSPIARYRISSRRRLSNICLRQYYHYLAPPLRAPPC